MKSIIIYALISLGFLSPSIEAIPPEVNTEGLCTYEIVVQPQPETEEQEQAGTSFNEADAEALAKMLYGEARGCTPDDMRNCCITACNRADDYRYPDTVCACVTQENQYYGYNANNPIEPFLYEIAVQVLIDWQLYKQGAAVDWNTFNCFSGDGVQNHFYTN